MTIADMGPRGKTNSYRDLQISLYTTAALKKYGKEPIGARGLKLMGEGEFEEYFTEQLKSENLHAWAAESANLTEFPQGYCGYGVAQWAIHHLQRGSKNYALDACDKQLQLLAEIEKELHGDDYETLFDHMLKLRKANEQEPTPEPQNWTLEMCENFAVKANATLPENEAYSGEEWKNWWECADHTTAIGASTGATGSDDMTIHVERRDLGPAPVVPNSTNN